jgi:hypothetical protein
MQHFAIICPLHGERAQRTGIPVSMTIEDIEKEIAQETGGQIARDIERLYWSGPFASPLP